MHAAPRVERRLTSFASRASICALDASGIRWSCGSSQAIFRAVAVSFSASSRRRGSGIGPLLAAAAGGSGLAAAAAAAEGEGGGMLPAWLLLPLLRLLAAAHTTQGRRALAVASAVCSRHNRGANTAAMVPARLKLQSTYVSSLLDRRAMVPAAARPAGAACGPSFPAMLVCHSFQHSSHSYAR